MTHTMPVVLATVDSAGRPKQKQAVATSRFIPGLIPHNHLVETELLTLVQACGRHM